MKNIFLLILLVPLLNIIGHSQTKLISHKSHSGSKMGFKLAAKKSLFNINESNFGMAPQRFIRNSNLDSVILISEKKAIMITSESCRWEDYGSREDKYNGKGEIWSAGLDTVEDHPVFTSKNSIKEIKSILKNEYFFSNPIDSVVFIGFDGNYPETKMDQLAQEVNGQPNNEVSVLNENEDQDEQADRKPRKRKSLFLIFVLSLFSLICNCDLH